MTLSEFVAVHYGPYRAEKRPRSWERERPSRGAGHWTFVLDKFGDWELEDLDAVSFDQWLEGLKGRRGQELSANTKRLIRSVYRNALQQAVKWGHLQEVHAFFRLEAKKKRRRPTVLTLQEVELLLQRSSVQRRAMWGLGIGAALRPSELIRGRWEYVDWDAQSYAVPGTKTERSDSLVPLLPIALESLRELWQARDRPRRGWMFPCRTGKPYQDPTSLRKPLRADAKRAGIKKHVYPYTLRHTGATLMLESGMGEYDVAKIMRHTSLQMLKRHYDHASALRCRTLGSAPTLTREPEPPQGLDINSLDTAEIAALLGQLGQALQERAKG